MPNLFLQGVQPHFLLGELQRLGEALVVAQLDTIPALDELKKVMRRYNKFRTIRHVTNAAELDEVLRVVPQPGGFYGGWITFPS